MKIELDIQPLVEAVRGIKDRQLPFAVALALTRTAQDAQAEVRREMPKRFTLRNNFVQQGIRITKATKQTFEATVYSANDFMTIHETGGVKTPRGRHVAVPQDARRNKRDIVTRGNRPRALLGKPNVFKAKLGGVEGLWQRVGSKKNRRLKLLWSLVPSVVIKPRFGFQDTVKATAQQRIARQFEVAFAEAVRTAR